MVTNPRPLAKFVLFVLLSILLSTSRALVQAPIVRSELHHDVSKPLRELAVNPPAMPSRIREADEPGMLRVDAGFKNIGRGGQGRD